MDAGGVNEANDCLDEMARLSNFERSFIAAWGLFVAVCYPILKAAFLINLVVGEEPEYDPDYWKKENRWLDALVPSYFKSAYSGCSEYLEETHRINSN